MAEERPEANMNMHASYADLTEVQLEDDPVSDLSLSSENHQLLSEESSLESDVFSSSLDSDGQRRATIAGEPARTPRSSTNTDGRREKRVGFKTSSSHNRSTDSNKSLEMRRGTIGDISRRNSGPGEADRKPTRRSAGSIFKEVEIKWRIPKQLINLVVRAEVQRRGLLRKFKLIVRVQCMLNRWWKRHSSSDVTSTHPFYMQYRMISDVSENPPDSAIDFKASYFKANKQMRMSQEAIRILSMKPALRTDSEIYYAMIALRGIDSIADYPLRMQKALATHGVFQSFGPKRIIVKQGHPPVCFYFILYGTVVVATLDPNSPYAKTQVTLRRGENFGELAIAHRIPRQSTVITMEYTEFLTIDCDTYENIFMAGGVKTIHDPDHNKFMRSLYFLKDWPIEKLQENPKAMEFCYFRRDTVMVKDSNMSDWIYIVKSGSLRVFKKLQKCYSSVNTRTGNYCQQAHTDGFHSFMGQKSEYNRYAVYNNVDLPPPLSPESDSDDDMRYGYKDHLDEKDEKENLLSLPLMQRVERLIRPRTAIGGVIATYGQSSVKRNIRSAKSERSRSNMRTYQKSEKSVTPRTVSSISNDDKSIEFPLEIDKEETGKRTLMDDYEQKSSRVKKKEVTAADLDPEFVLVQTLTKGQAFGIQQLFIEDQPSMVVVSGGAECVMLNKKFYKEHVNPNTAQRIMQQLSPYPSDSALQENLQTRVNWMKYRQITLNNIVSRQRDGKSPRAKLKDKRLAFR